MKITVVVVLGILAILVAGLYQQNSTLRQECARHIGEIGRLNERLKRASAKAEPNRPASSQDLEVLRLRGQVATLQAQLAEKEAQLKAAQARLAESAARRPRLEPASSTLAGNTNARQRFVMGLAVMEGEAMKKANETIARVRTKLNLTADQEQALRELMRQRAQRLNYLMTRDTNGTPRLRSASIEHGQEVDDIMNGSVFGSLGERVRAILSPEQQTAYQELLRQEAAGKAGNELKRAQDLLGLAEEQNKQMYAVLYEEACQMLGPPPSDRRAEVWLSQLLDKRMNALQSILTPEQMQVYRQHSPKAPARED